METVRPLLAQAEENARVKQWDAVLLALLQAWRHRRATLLADVVDVAGQRAAGARRPLALSEEEDVWRRTCHMQDPADLPRLLAVLGDAETEPDVVTKRLSLLELWPDDPRLAAHFAHLIEQMPWRHGTARDAYKPVFRTLERIGDRRTLETLERTLYIDRRGDTGFADWYTKRLRSTFDNIRNTDKEELPGPEAERVRTLRKMIAGVSTNIDYVTELYLAVRDDPFDDDLRLVLADALHEVGDPRGEFIMLQMAEHRGQSTRRGRRRVRKLLQRYGDEWLGELRHVAYSFEFRRGFLASCNVQPNLGALRQVMHSPLWATVEQVRGPTFFLLSDALRALRHVEITRWQLRELLEEPGEIRFTGLTTEIVDRHDTNVLLRVLDRMSELTELYLTDGHADLHAVVGHARFNDRVQELSVWTHASAGNALLPRLQETSVQRFTIRDVGRWRWTYTRDDEELAVVDIECEVGTGPEAEDLIRLTDALERIPRSFLHSIAIRTPVIGPADGGARARVPETVETLDIAHVQLPKNWPATD